MSLPHWEVARRGAGRRGEVSGSPYCGAEGGRLSGNGNEGLGHHGERVCVRFMLSVRGKGGSKELGKSTTANKAQLNSAQTGEGRGATGSIVPKPQRPHPQPTCISQSCPIGHYIQTGFKSFLMEAATLSPPLCYRDVWARERHPDFCFPAVL